MFYFSSISLFLSLSLSLSIYLSLSLSFSLWIIGFKLTNKENIINTTTSFWRLDGFFIYVLSWSFDRFDCFLFF